MPAPVKYDWTAAEAAFVYAPDDGNRVTLKTISEQFGISYQTVRRYAANNEWIKKRLDYIRPQRITKQLQTVRNPYVAEMLRQELGRSDAHKH
jgi:predicted transcriptional regulator